MRTPQMKSCVFILRTICSFTIQRRHSREKARRVGDSLLVGARKMDTPSHLQIIMPGIEFTVLYPDSCKHCQDKKEIGAMGPA